MDPMMQATQEITRLRAQHEEVMEVLRGPFGQGRILQNGEWRAVTDKEVAERIVGWGRSLDHFRLHNLGKWAQMIHATCSVDQPELLIEIDCALECYLRFLAALQRIASAESENGCILSLNEAVTLAGEALYNDHR